ncbi:MAG: isoprenoid biosynthesis glyoxalase ElbB [Deltaproteobacteria bacterium]|nr:isoprenoid biosynthesis glyoxalase ElbB [Deltaproteobacteria bacterium]
MKTVLLLLNGCGHQDGSEVHESVFAMAALESRFTDVIVACPDAPQSSVINHLSSEELTETRNMLVEAARIARGRIRPLKSIRSDDFDALVIPGGFGVAKNFCNFAQAGRQMEVRSDIASLILNAADAGKPLGMICIAPVLAGKLLGDRKPQLTLGKDPQMAAIIESWGGRHIPCHTTEAITDSTQRLVTTPAYMDAKARMNDVRLGIERMADSLINLT